MAPGPADNFDHAAVHEDNPNGGDLCQADIGDEQTCLDPIIWVGPDADDWLHSAEVDTIHDE